MFPNYNFDPKPQEKPLPEPEFLDSPFDRWLRLADLIIEKHKKHEDAEDFSN